MAPHAIACATAHTLRRGVSCLQVCPSTHTADEITGSPAVIQKLPRASLGCTLATLLADYLGKSQCAIPDDLALAQWSGYDTVAEWKAAIDAGGEYDWMQQNLTHVRRQLGEANEPMADFMQVRELHARVATRVSAHRARTRAIHCNVHALRQTWHGDPGTP